MDCATIDRAGVAYLGCTAAAAGMKGVQHFDSKDDVLEALRAILGRGDVLLVKASHGIALHTVVEALAEAEEPSHA